MWGAVDLEFPAEKEMRMSLEERYGKALYSRICNSVVAVCGLGGLGSNIAVALARAGIGKLILIDFDRVDISNLNRQQYKAVQVGAYKSDALNANIKEIAPYVNVDAHNKRITEENLYELLCGADIICEAFDNAEAKAMLVNCVSEAMPDKYLIAASGMAGLGSANAVKTRKITEHFFICGDEISDVNDGIGPISSRVMLCAAHQAHMVLRIIAKHYDA